MVFKKNWFNFNKKKQNIKENITFYDDINLSKFVKTCYNFPQATRVSPFERPKFKKGAAEFIKN